jgi:hypothetical protein
MFYIMVLLISAPGTSLSAGGSGSLLVAEATAGSPLSRPPAGVFVPSAEINRVEKLSSHVLIYNLLISLFNKFFSKEKLAQKSSFYDLWVSL